MIRIKVLIENKTYKTEYLGEHGLSLYIETDDKKILYDTGMSGAFVENAKIMGVNLKEVDFAVISHGHHDHAGGVPAFCMANEHAPVYIHKGVFIKPYPMENGKLSDNHCGIRWIDMRERLENRLILTDKTTWISEDIAISGTIPKEPGFESTAQFYVRNEDGVLVPDEMEHEQFLAVRVKDAGGIFVFSGCSHTGVETCVKYAHELFPGERIMALVAGMHLYGADTKLINSALDEILKLDVKMYVPLHCTGMEAICSLKARLSDRCVILNTGDSYIWN